MYLWMAASKRLNYLYKSKPALISLNETKRRIEKTADILLRQTINTFDETCVNTTNVARADVAEIRASSTNSRSGCTTNTPHQRGEVGGDDKAPIIDNADAHIANTEAPLTCYVTDSDKTANGSRSDSTHEYLNCAAHTIHIDVE